MLRFEILPLEVLDYIFKIVEDEEKEEKEKNFYKTKFKYVLKEIKNKKSIITNRDIRFYKKTYYRVFIHLNYIFSHFGERYQNLFNATKLFKNHKRKLNHLNWRIDYD
jgi:hypothetical protein